MGRAGAGRPESAVPAARLQPSMETGMNFIAPRAEPLIREIPLSRLALAPENVRKTPPYAQADAELKASIAALGLPSAHRRSRPRSRSWRPARVNSPSSTMTNGPRRP